MQKTKYDKSGYSNSAKSPINQAGNKRSLLSYTDFTKYFPTLSRGGVYVELFCGTGVVFFDYASKRNINTCVVLNDENCMIQKFFTTMTQNKEELEKRLEGLWCGLEDFIKPKDDIDKIIIWYLKNKSNPLNINRPSPLEKDFTFWCEILNKHNVLFTSEDWKKSHHTIPIRKGDSRTNIIYCDPPYDKTQKYESEFDLDEWAQFMNEKYIENKQDHTHVFISLNDTIKVRELFKDWYSKELYTFSKRNSNKERTEILFSNHPIKDYTEKTIKLSNYFEYI